MLGYGKGALGRLPGERSVSEEEKDKTNGVLFKDELAVGMGGGWAWVGGGRVTGKREVVALQRAAFRGDDQKSGFGKQESRLYFTAFPE